MKNDHFEFLESTIFTEFILTGYKIDYARSSEENIIREKIIVSNYRGRFFINMHLPAIALVVTDGKYHTINRFIQFVCKTKTVNMKYNRVF